MSQIEHRQRLRERREADARRGLQGFSPSTGTQQIRPAAQQTAPETSPEPVPLAAVSAEDAGPQVVQSQPVAQQAVVPVDVNTRGMSPTEMRAHGKQTAEMLAALPQAEYEATLKALETSNPNLYGIVVDELNNIAAAQQGGEGDGFDLSGLAAGAVESPTPAAEVVGETTDPNSP